MDRDKKCGKKGEESEQTDTIGLHAEELVALVDLVFEQRALSILIKAVHCWSTGDVHVMCLDRNGEVGRKSAKQTEVRDEPVVIHPGALVLWLNVHCVPHKLKVCVACYGDDNARECE